MKRFLPYMCLSIIAIFVSMALSKIFHFSLSNTWQGLLALTPILGPYYVYGWKMSQEIKNKSFFLFFYMRFFLVMTIIAYVTAFFVVLFELFF